MKTRNYLAVIGPLLLAFILIQSCGLSVTSESSCKNTLCKGFWSYEYNAAPMISSNGNFIFKKDGTCQYCTVGHQWNGTWSLGNVVDVTKKISYRTVDVKMESDIGMGAGSDFIMKLYAGDKNTLDLSEVTYYHFGDNNKPLD